MVNEYKNCSNYVKEYFFRDTSDSIFFFFKIIKDNYYAYISLILCRRGRGLVFY